MAFSPLVFSKSWENAEDFPTYEPNEAQVRADLQLLHEETRAWINNLTAALNDPSAAAGLPFAPTAGLTAQTVQQAVEEVYAAVREAAAGQLVDGTIGKEKLTAQLLERIYGGRVWVSLDCPDAACNPDSDFPVGQLWLRPRFMVDNLLTDSWILSGGTMQSDGREVTFVSDGSQAYLTAQQTLSCVGSSGQRVFVSVEPVELDDHLSDVVLYLNGLGHDLTTGGVFETQLDASGSLEVVIRGQWPYAEADAVIRLTQPAAVNADGVLQQVSDCADVADWAGLVRSLIPFTQAVMPRRLFVQTKFGVWVQIDHEVLPVSRGGTGLDTLQAGQLLYGGTDCLQQLAAGADGSFLQCSGGLPRWQDSETTIGSLGLLRTVSGSYQGQYTTRGRTFDLPIVPKLLYLCCENGDENPVMLIDGARATGNYTHTSKYDSKTYYYTAEVRLSGSQLKFSHEAVGSNNDAPDRHFNQSGTTYRWMALY